MGINTATPGATLNVVGGTGDTYILHVQADDGTPGGDAYIKLDSRGSSDKAQLWFAQNGTNKFAIGVDDTDSAFIIRNEAGTENFRYDNTTLWLSGTLVAAAMSASLLSASAMSASVLSASAFNLSPTTGSKAGPTSYLVLDTENRLVLAAGGEAGPAGSGGIFTTPNGSTAYTTSSVKIGGSGTPTHPLEVAGLISASAGLTGSALKVEGAISGSIIYGDGSELIGVSGGPTSLASGSAKLNFDTSSGELSGSGPLKIGGAAQLASTLAVTGNVQLASALAVTGNVSTQGYLSASGQLQLAKAAGHGVYIGGSQVLSQTTLGSTVLGSSLTSVGTLSSLGVGAVTSTGNISSSLDGRFYALDINGTANVIDKDLNFSGKTLSGSLDLTLGAARSVKFGGSSALSRTGLTLTSSNGGYFNAAAGYTGDVYISSRNSNYDAKLKFQHAGANVWTLQKDNTFFRITDEVGGIDVLSFMPSGGRTVLSSSLSASGGFSGSSLDVDGMIRAGAEISSSSRLQLGGAGSVSIGGTNCLTRTTLGSTVVNSSLTSVGTLTSLTSAGNVSASADVMISGSLWGAIGGSGTSGLAGGLQCGLSVVTGSEANAEADDNWDYIGRTAERDVYIDVRVPVTGEVLLSMEFTQQDSSSSQLDFWMKLGTSTEDDETGATTALFYVVDSNRTRLERHRVQWHVTGLTPGSLVRYYAWWLCSSPESEETISWGGEYGPIILKAETVTGLAAVLTS